MTEAEKSEAVIDRLDMDLQRQIRGGVAPHGVQHVVAEVGLEAGVLDDGHRDLLVVAEHAVLDGVVQALKLKGETERPKFLKITLIISMCPMRNSGPL